MEPFTFEIDEDGAAILSWDTPGKSMNVMSFDGIGQLDSLISRALDDSATKCIVITSSKADFAGGMDINDLAGMLQDFQSNPARGIFDAIMEIHRVLRRIESETARKGIPVVSALPGTAVGIGFELALACHYILCADNPGARIGLPETKIGLFPGAGGTTRLVRRLGAADAVPLLVRGTTLPASKALASRLVDEVVPQDQLLSAAKAWALAANPEDICKAWDGPGFRLPGGGPYSIGGFPKFVGLSASVNGTTQNALPAIRCLLSAIYEGALVPFDAALKVEARWFTELLLDPSSQAMMRSIFLEKKRLDRRARRATGNIKHLAVIGAGMMGSGIALVAAQARLPVELIDSDISLAEKGKSAAQNALEIEVGRGRLARGDADAILNLIRPSANLDSVRQSDLVIEAVFEDAAVKADVLKRVSEVAQQTCIIASNTSTLPISELAQHIGQPSKFIGLHFFSPVHRMPLLEIIRGKSTHESVVTSALHFASRIRKTPIVVGDSRFFYTNRCVVPYLNEAIRMVGEGIAPALIEHAALQLGTPVGPLQLIDETSLTLAADIASETRKALGNAYCDSDVDRVLAKMLDHERPGRKGKAGFYSYDQKGRRRELWKDLSVAFPSSVQQPDLSLVKNRLLIIQVIEAIKTLDEEVLNNAGDGDVGALLGWGFPPWTGGPFSWVDMMGANAVFELCQELAAKCGTRFEPPPLLVRKARANQNFRN